MEVKINNRALELAHTKRYVRARELAQVGASGGTLQKLLKNNKLIRISRGLYTSAGGTATELDDLAQLAVKSPHLVFCLLTALQIHGLTTQSPHEVWVAISSKARAPSLSYPPLHIIRFSDLWQGVEQKAIDGVVHIPVTTVAKTVADCFKFRNKIGLDIALEALRDAYKQKKVTMDELWEAAQLCRVANVMRPYLESLV